MVQLPATVAWAQAPCKRGQRPPCFTFFSLSSYGQDDDIVFEDFARLRLKGLKDDKEEEQFC